MSVLATSAVGAAAAGAAAAGADGEELSLEVAGLMHDPDGAAVHLRWLQQPLAVGQRVTLTVVETGHADPPQSRQREDPAWVEQRKRAYYARLKAELGET
jgi:hypothetical protein